MAALALLSALLASPAAPHQVSTAPVSLAPVVVSAPRPFTAASSRVIRDRDLALRPAAKPADLLKAAPGLVTGQHAGGGKANQYFLRGFDADHGSDVALWLDGMPVNMVSHAHGQGYADLHFVIPELIGRLEVDKGPYFAERGDFATAGAIRLATRRRFAESLVSATAGAYGSYRGLALLKEEGRRPALAFEAAAADGPFEHPERLRRANGFARATLVDDAEAALTLTAMSYAGRWNGSGQIPEREVEAGRLSRFGSVDPSEGGSSERHSLAAEWSSKDDGERAWTLSAYAARYRLQLFSNFTFFANDPVNGDGIEQADSRWLGGAKGAYRRRAELLGRAGLTTVGFEARHDDIRARLNRSRSREFLAPVVDASVRQSSLGLFAEEDVSLAEHLRLVAGLRADGFRFDVTDRLPELAPAGTATSGARQAGVLSPKASLVSSALHGYGVELFLNYGQGFHSNDARGVVRSPGSVTPLTKSRGYEAGARGRFRERLDLAAAAWRLDLRNETVWVGDDGTTAARGATRRYGVDAEARLQLLPWLWADADVSVSRARFVADSGGGTLVPLAPTLTVTGGLSARHASGAFGSLRVERVADRPATEDGSLTARGQTVWDLALGWRRGRWEAGLSVLNLLDAEWREAQFANESRLKSETAPVADIHFVPGAPRHVQGTIKLYF